MYAQSGQKFASGGNILSNGEFFGTLNNFPINVKVNNTLLSSFTTTGFDVYGNLHSTKNTVVDSILSSWKVMVADALSVGGNLSVSGSATINGDAIVIGTLKGGLVTITGNNINSASGTISFVTNDIFTNGNISSNTAKIDGITIASNSIKSSTGKIDFANNQLLTTGNISSATATIDGIKIDHNQIISSSGQIGFANNNLITTGDVKATNITTLQSKVNDHNLQLSNHQVELVNHQSSIDSIEIVIGVQESVNVVQQQEIYELSGQVGNLHDSVSALKDQITNINSSQWQNSGTNSIAYSGTAIVNGDFQSGSISTGQLTISDNFIAPKGDFDTLKAAKQLFVNHNLILGSDSGSMISDIASRVERLMIQSDPVPEAMAKDVIIVAKNEGKIGIGMTEGLIAKLNVQGNTQLNGDLNVSGNANLEGSLTSQGTIEANTINASNINLNGTPFSGQFVHLTGDTMAGSITLGSGTSVNHSTSNAALTFDALGAQNVVGLGFNAGSIINGQGLAIAPKGTPGYPNGVIGLADADSNAQIIIGLGTGESGTRINLDGTQKKIVIQNDGGDRLYMGGVNDPTLWESTKGFNIAPRSGFAFTGSQLLGVQGDVVVAGNLQSNSITTTNINITESIKTKSAEFDTLRVVERMAVEKYIQSDTLHALSSLEVNNSLRLRRDTSVMYAEMSTKDTAVALMLQKDASATVAIGAELIPTAGEAKPKLTVSGNTKLDGGLNVTGNISTAGSIDANSITTSGLSVSGITDFDELQVAGKIKAYRIVPVDGDSIIRFGTNTLIYDDVNQTISTDFGKGLAIGWGNNNDIDLYNNALALGFQAIARADRTVALGNSAMATGINSVAIAGHWAWAQAPYSLAIGNNIATDPAAKNSIILGSGGLNNGAFINDKPNSLMVGFNSTIPTLFVGPAQTEDGTGNVGIGTSAPLAKLHVYGDPNSNNAKLRLENFFNNASSIWDFEPVIENSTGRLMIGTPGDPLFAITADDGVNIKSKLNIGSLTPNPTTYDLTIHNGTSANLSSIQLANASSGNTPMDGLVMSSSAGDAVFSLMEDGDYRFGSGNPMTGEFNEKMVIKANGNVGIGTNDPSEKLDVKGNIRINENDIFFRSLLPDGNHGLGWYGDPDNNSQTANSKSFASVDIDGPVLFGFKGGALGSTENGKKIALRWDQKGNVGIGTMDPMKMLHVGSIGSANNPIVGSIRIEGGGNSNNNWRNWDFEVGPPDANTTPYNTHRLRISNNGNEVATIDEEGNVGIGTDAPQEKLSVRASDISSVSNSVFSSKIAQFIYEEKNNTDPASSPRLDIWGHFGKININNNTIGKINLRASSNSGNGTDLTLGTELAPNSIVIKGNTQGAGQVGIGTDEPLSKLHIYGTGQDPSLSANTEILLIGNDVSQALAIGADPNGPYGMWMQTKQINNNSNNNSSYPISLNPLGGNVGIGTTNPQALLDVKGTIRMEEGKVCMGTCDFVFEPNYGLLSLEKRKQNILKNKHLPNIKPAKDIEENGASIGEIASGLLQNVEEHELYLYDHAEKITILQKENKELREKIDTLSKAIEVLKKEKGQE